MSEIEHGLRQIAEIRSLMERSGRFLSLSGLAGVAAGVIGLAGAWTARVLLEGGAEVGALVLLGLAVLVGAIAASLALTVRQARRDGQALWSPPARLVLLSLAVPLLGGGSLCAAMLLHGHHTMLAAVMLLFYGVALFSASHFTHRELRQLAYVQLALGMLAAFLPEHSLLLWAGGFGVMHIVYGLLMFLRRERHAHPVRH